MDSTGSAEIQVLEETYPHPEGPGLLLTSLGGEIYVKASANRKENQNVLSPGKSPAQPLHPTPQETARAVLLVSGGPGSRPVLNRQRQKQLLNENNNTVLSRATTTGADFADTQRARAGAPAKGADKSSCYERIFFCVSFCISLYIK